MAVAQLLTMLQTVCLIDPPAAAGNLRRRLVQKGHSPRSAVARTQGQLHRYQQVKAMERFTTAALKSAGKTKAWNKIYSGMLAAADFIPHEANFSAGLQICQVGDVGLARLETGRCAIHRTEQHIDEKSPKLYSFIIQANGRGLLVQGENRVVLNRGDFALCDHTLPHSRILEDNAEMLIIRVPGSMIGDYLPDPEQHCGRRLPGNGGMASAAGLWARSLWHRLETTSPTDYDSCLAHHLLDLIATSYSMAFGTGPAEMAHEEPRLRTVQNFIEDQLHDPDFRPGSIPTALRMDPDDLRKLFADTDESARSYLLRRRLAVAARRLRDPRWRGHTIAEIAHRCGFSSNAMFSRAFRERYDVSPKEFRG